MEVLLTVLVCLFGVINAVAFVIICQDAPEEFGDIRDQTLLHTLAILLVLPAIAVYWVTVVKMAGFWKFLNSKPFKVAKFEVGEKVLYDNLEYTVIENEKTTKGERIRIGRGYGSMLIETKNIRKVSKLEQALK